MATNPSFRKFNYAQLDMAHEVINLSKKNQSITDLVKEYADTIVTADDKVKIIDSIIAPQSANNTGISSDKQGLKTLLADSIFSISHPVAGYAAAQNNQSLEKKLDKAYTSIRKMRDQKISSFAKDVIETVTPLLPLIINTGITQETLDALDKANQAFSAVATAPRNAKVIRVQLTKSLSDKMEEVMNIINRTLDRVAVRFSAIDEKQFYAQYKSARKLQPYGNTHTRADVTVTMGDSNAPVPDAVVEIEGTSLKAVTDKNGRCTISPTPVGSRKLIVTAPGFPTPVTTPAYNFVRGKATRITVPMTNFNVPAAAPAKKSATVNN
jgi:hypothetical protein